MSACEHSRESITLLERYLNHKSIGRVRVCNYTDQGNAWYLEKRLPELQWTAPIYKSFQTPATDIWVTQRRQKKELWHKGINYLNKTKMLSKSFADQLQRCVCAEATRLWLFKFLLSLETERIEEAPVLSYFNRKYKIKLSVDVSKEVPSAKRIN